MHLNKTSFELVSQQEKHLLKEERKKEENEEGSNKEEGQREKDNGFAITKLNWRPPFT
jgi:hypothetical protein